MQAFIAPRVLGLGIIAALAGCGGDGASDSVPSTSSAAADAGAPDAGAAIDPCALVTKAEVDEALGATSTEERPSEANYPPTLVTCRYTAPRGAGVAVMTVMVRTGWHSRPSIA